MNFHNWQKDKRSDRCVQYFFFAKGRFLLTSLSDNHTSIPTNEKNNSLRIVNFKAKRWQSGEFNHNYYCHYYNKNKGDFQSCSEKELVWKFLENLWENNHNRVFLSRFSTRFNFENILNYQGCFFVFWNFQNIFRPTFLWNAVVYTAAAIKSMFNSIDLNKVLLWRILLTFTFLVNLNNSTENYRFVNIHLKNF